ncbi:MAG: type II toxin-antitoxin system HicA family toxin [Bacteroidetes bacterium]|nr:MAG: type II toxin-antitoxin system HicA family toxin [Bacteroidota bacterium]RLD79563.1 MAG: type II toxin-antitoxin system HicA family toxin [Bacteroidota bacterium]
MSIGKLSNIPLKDFRNFLRNKGLNIIKTSKGRGGHEKWSRLDLDRPITIQTHVDPVPEFIVKQVLRHLKMTRKEFVKAINK